MAFFEQLGKKISDAGQGVANSTRNLADISKLNSSIAEKRKQITQIFTEIGEAYYNKYKDDPRAEELDRVAAVKRLTDEITQAEEEIRVRRGITKCPNCGADVPNSAAFCSFCGATMNNTHAAESAPMAPAHKECPVCHAIMDEGNAFCTNCGTKLE